MKLASFVNDLKSRYKERQEENYFHELRTNPKYAPAIDKLEQLIKARDLIKHQLEKVELDIDACIMALAVGEKKEEIEELISNMRQ